MSLTTDVPVQFDDIRVGDYIIGTGRPESGIPGTMHQGFVVAIKTTPSGNGVKIRQDNGKETSMGRHIRTFTRRTHAINPALHLVDPAALSAGDKVTVYDGAGLVVEEGATVDAVVSCGDGLDVYMKDALARCTDVNPQYQWFRHVSLPESWESLGQISDQTHYPTIHHLKAAIFDLLVQNVDNGTWCEEGASEFARDYTIATGLGTEALDNEARVVSNTIARLQRETAQSLGTFRGLAQAFKTLGIPQLPKTRRVRLEVEVPEGLTHNQIREMLAGQQNITLLVTQEVSR